MQTSIAIGWLRAPARICEIQRLCGFFSFDSSFTLKKKFSRFHVAAERSVAQTCMIAQTMRFDVRRCPLGVSLMYACVKGSRIPRNPPKFRPLWEIQA
jgi:hypothetical protein